MEVTVVGGGRVGLSIARALRASGSEVAVLSRVDSEWDAMLGRAAIVVIAVPDDAIDAVSRRLAESGAISARHAVLHTSGALDRTALHPLSGTAAALGSLHPLQSFNDPRGSPELLNGCPAIVEGDERALLRADALATALGMTPVLRLDAAGKRRYHAAAVVASNYLVVLAEVATQLARDAGLDASAALFAPLMQQTLDNLLREGTERALTGPIRRGDAGTVAAHLAALDGETREVYRVLGLAAVSLARRAGLDATAAARVLGALK